MNNKNPIQIVGPVKQPVVAELPVQPKPRTEIMAAGGSGGQGVAGAQGSAAAQQQLVDAAAVAATQQGSVPVGPRGAANSQVEIGSNIQTPVAGSEQNTQKDTPTQTVPAPTSTPSGEKAYTLAELTALQEKETADDIYERYTLGKNFIRVGSGYTNTPNERTYRLAQPFDGMWYYDPGEKVYAGTPGSEAYFDENGNWKAPAGYAPQVGNSGSAGGTAGTSKFGNTGSSGSSLTALLEEWKKAAAEQANGQIDYAVAQAITELERALEDAQPAFREAAEAVSREEAQALDNSALYAELRGDKGGIGQSQYNEIQAAAAQNRLAIQQAQTKLATDTARQIADLRAQGEFEKVRVML